MNLKTLFPSLLLFTTSLVCYSTPYIVQDVVGSVHYSDTLSSKSSPLKKEATFSTDFSITTSPLSSCSISGASFHVNLEENTTITVEHTSSNKLVIRLLTGTINVERFDTNSSPISVETILGSIHPGSSSFKVSLWANNTHRQYVLTVLNNKGPLDLTSRYASNLEYNSNNTAETNFNPQLTDTKPDSIPEQHTAIIKLSYFNVEPLDAYILSFIKLKGSHFPSPVMTPHLEDPSTIIVSPEGGL